MHRFVSTIDRFSTFLGKIFAWSIVLLTLTISYEVCARYLFGRPTAWAYDTSYMLYGTLFMLAGPYTLARNGHVRGDFVYRRWQPRRQAAVDLVLYGAFFFPAMAALVYAGVPYFRLSLQINETSPFSPFGLLIWPYKVLIPTAGALMLLQGMAEVMRCMACLRTGQWPPRLNDIEETEAALAADNQADAGNAPEALR